MELVSIHSSVRVPWKDCRSVSWVHAGACQAHMSMDLFAPGVSVSFLFLSLFLFILICPCITMACVHVKPLSVQHLVKFLHLMTLIRREVSKKLKIHRNVVFVKFE